ncbi:MAG TPA: hypothetical protein VK943_11615, partial [Arenibaculum sp.]|nr:hypothetical protein [Arenibaculum sp.]
RLPGRTALLVALLAGCASERAAPVPAGDTGQAACIRSCNRAYDICMEAGAARIGDTLGGMPLTGGGSCERQLRRCTATCRAAP